MKNNPIICVCMIAAWCLGTFGGFGYLWYYHLYHIAVSVALLGAMAAPFVINYMKETQKTL